MKSRLKAAFFLLVAGAWMTGCASSGYSPPERTRAFERCPIGEVWVCTDRYPSRIDRDDEIPMLCMCRDPQRIR